MTNIKYINNIDRVPGLPGDTVDSPKKVTRQYRFRANDYYLSLINWDDPDDPIRRIIMPAADELKVGGDLDPSREGTNYAAPGLQHKYYDTALLLCSDRCGAYCRFCFRKRIFIDHTEVSDSDFTEAIDYISRNKQICNILVSGGDPLMLPTDRLESLISELCSIDHISTIRIGSKMPAFNPYRIIDDPKLLGLFRKYSTPERRLWLISHFNVINEVSPAAIKAIQALLSSGAVLSNQTPLLAGVNDTPEALKALFNRLVAIGIPPYYIFQCRPTAGNQSFAVPITRGYRILRQAGKQISGMAMWARYIMSHATGKIEIVGVTDSHIYMRYHRARDPEDDGRFMIFKRNDRAYWLEDLISADEKSNATEVVERHWRNR